MVGVPKTIDNDLGGTDVTFGFDTALTVATSAIDKLHSTAEAHHRIMVIEVMGRYAGWIALHAGMAGGGDVILVPELPFRMEKIVRQDPRPAQRRETLFPGGGRRGRPARGRPTGGRPEKWPAPTSRCAWAEFRQLVGNQIEDLTGIETRYTILGHVQRGGSPTPFDRILATRFGFHAVEAAVAGTFGTLVGVRGAEIQTVSLDEALASPRRIRPDNDLIRTALALGTSFGI